MEKKKKLLMLVKKTLRPEFLNRLDEVIVFNNLSEKNLQQIIKKSYLNLKLVYRKKKYILIFPQYYFLP